MLRRLSRVHRGRIAASHKGVLTMIALAAPLLAATAQATQPAVQGELRLRWDAARANAHGPMAVARGWAPGLSPPPTDAATAEAELRGHWRDGTASLSAQVLLQATRAVVGTSGGGNSDTTARINELALSGDHGAWQTSAGRKVISWDVGQAFRPNDLVQQEVRRSLLPTPLQGRPVLQLEHFDADASTALVWANPHHFNATAQAQRGAEESALAARWYGRTAGGAADLHAFARLGRHTGASLGAASAWVASDALEVHASARVAKHHDGWQTGGGSSGSLASANPWQIATLGRTAQALLGASWTGESQQSLLVEWWHDGTAPSDAMWRDWGARNAALAAAATQPGVPTPAVAGNLAWQASPLAGVLGAPSLRRNNLFVRLAWQPGPWTTSLDAWITPADRGRALTASVQWQGDRVKLQAAVRQVGGPRDAVLAQMPTRRSAALQASWAF